MTDLILLLSQSYNYFSDWVRIDNPFSITLGMSSAPLLVILFPPHCFNLFSNPPVPLHSQRHSCVPVLMI